MTSSLKLRARNTKKFSKYATQSKTTGSYHLLQFQVYTV